MRIYVHFRGFGDVLLFNFNLFFQPGEEHGRQVGKWIDPERDPARGVAKGLQCWRPMYETVKYMRHIKPIQGLLLIVVLQRLDHFIDVFRTARG